MYVFVTFEVLSREGGKHPSTRGPTIWFYDICLVVWVVLGSCWGTSGGLYATVFTCACFQNCSVWFFLWFEINFVLWEVFWEVGAPIDFAHLPLHPNIFVVHLGFSLNATRREEGTFEWRSPKSLFLVCFGCFFWITWAHIETPVHPHVRCWTNLIFCRILGGSRVELCRDTVATPLFLICVCH